MKVLKLDLELDKERYYLPKDVFNYPNLSIMDIRLLIVLTSKNDYTIKDIDFQTKQWIACRPAQIKLIKQSEQTLKDIGLINSDGTGINLVENKKNYIVFKDIAEIEKCKSIRQLFLMSLDKWYNKGTVILNKDMFYNLFGSSTKSIINKNWKASNRLLNVPYQWKKMKNTIHITNPIKNIKNSNEVVEQNKVNENKSKNKEKITSYKDYLKSEHWIKISTELKDRIKKCQLCSSTKNLNVHHNTYKNLGHEEPEDLIVLCNECHKKFHNILD